MEVVGMGSRFIGLVCRADAIHGHVVSACERQGQVDSVALQAGR